MRKYSTESGRQAAKRLQGKLDNDPNLTEMRRRLRIPYRGFHDADQAACWLYYRRPRYELIAPSYKPPYAIMARVPRILVAPYVDEVSALAETARYLCRQQALDPEWEFPLCFYLLRGKLEPLPRKRERRERPQAERDKYLLDLMRRHSYRHTQIIYNSGLSEEEFQAIVEAHPHASDDKLEWLCYDMGDEKGCLRRELIKYDNLRKIKSRWGWSDTAS